MNYYQYPPFPGYPYGAYPMTNMMGTQPMTRHMTGEQEQTHIENILRLNLGKSIAAYMNFENSQWGSKIFKGILEAVGKDHIIISDQNSNMRYLLLTNFLNYITFDDEINYYYPSPAAQNDK